MRRFQSILSTSSTLIVGKAHASTNVCFLFLLFSHINIQSQRLEKNPEIENFELTTILLFLLDYYIYTIGGKLLYGGNFPHCMRLLVPEAPHGIIILNLISSFGLFSRVYVYYVECLLVYILFFFCGVFYILYFHYFYQKIE